MLTHSVPQITCHRPGGFARSWLVISWLIPRIFRHLPFDSVAYRLVFFPISVKVNVRFVQVSLDASVRPLTRRHASLISFVISFPLSRYHPVKRFFSEPARHRLRLIRSLIVPVCCRNRNFFSGSTMGRTDHTLCVFGPAGSTMRAHTRLHSSVLRLNPPPVALWRPRPTGPLLNSSGMAETESALW